MPIADLLDDHGANWEFDVPGGELKVGGGSATMQDAGALHLHASVEPEMTNATAELVWRTPPSLVGGDP
jgi:hypothetical protein